MGVCLCVSSAYAAVAVMTHHAAYFVRHRKSTCVRVCVFVRINERKMEEGKGDGGMRWIQLE